MEQPLEVYEKSGDNVLISQLHISLIHWNKTDAVSGTASFGLEVWTRVADGEVWPADDVWCWACLPFLARPVSAYGVMQSQRSNGCAVSACVSSLSASR